MPFSGTVGISRSKNNSNYVSWPTNSDIDIYNRKTAKFM